MEERHSTQRGGRMVVFWGLNLNVRSRPVGILKKEAKSFLI